MDPKKYNFKTTCNVQRSQVLVSLKHITLDKIKNC